ncbi:DUF6113 family protein [Thermomonospora cellulosilytica]|uniref:Uncharacterized protein n=1 Tax=Thermomonospora cellulosilytica TaxID=1411118 RepID=A0A7W3MXQ4_9ACTN|nr:DUF6113 family protein [Thermomonospora cellulosilytica]MBA9003820.1 hypothetical protein [Thermomonospora cellulosilytica]
MDEKPNGGVPLTKDDGAPAPPPAAPASGREAAVVAGAAYGVLALLGVLLGVVGSLHYGWSAGTVPVAALALVAVNFAVCRLAGWGMGGKLGAATPWTTWMAVVILASAERSEGDLLIAGDLAGYVFLVGGMVSGGLAVAVTRSAAPAGSWLVGPGLRGRG